MDGRKVNQIIYDAVHSNKTYSEIVRILTPMVPEGHYQQPKQKVLEAMCGYFGYEKCRYDFWGYSSPAQGITQKTKIGRQYRSRIKQDTRFSEVLSWLEQDANKLQNKEERDYVLKVILPHHKERLGITQPSVPRPSEPPQRPSPDDLPSIEWMKKLIKQLKKEGKVGHRGTVPENTLKAEAEARYYRAQHKTPAPEWWDKVKKTLASAT
jgi:hypothetical protein